MAKYTFIGVFTKDDDSDIYTVSFPDVQGTVTEGEGVADAIEMARDALYGMLLTLEALGREVPKASERSELVNYLHSEDDFLKPITVETGGE